VQSLFWWIADLLRPWHDNGLPEELQFGEIEAEGFVREAMHRAAGFSVEGGFAFGIFQVIGLEYAARAARAWRPRELLLMEDVSLAFQGVWSRAMKGFSVPPIHIERTVLTLSRYLDYIGQPRDPEQIREAIEQFIQEERANRQGEGSEGEVEP
jgi:hypothetical protein